MKYFSFIFLFLLVSCNSPDKFSEEWFEKELADPNSKYSEEFEVLAKEMANDEELKDKYSITTLLMTDAFLNLSSLDQYLKSLQICAANFSVMYGFMEAGIKMGETVTGLTDTDEMSRLSNEYVNHAYYFAVRGTEIDASDSGASGEVIIFNPSNTTFMKHYISTVNSMNEYPGSTQNYVAGYFNTTSALTGIRFNSINSNVMHGTIKLYGLKDS